MRTLAHSAPETMISRPSRGWIASLTLLFAVACDPGGSGVDPVPESCDEVETAVLEVGEVVAFDGSAASLLCVGALDGTEAFVLVGVYRTDKPESERLERLALTASAENTVVVTSPPAARAGAAAPRGGDVVRGSGATGSLDASPDATLAGSTPLRAPRLDHEFHIGLRQRERELIGAGPRRDLPSRPPMAAGAAGRVPSVGELMELNAQPDEPCKDPIPVTGQVRAVSERAIVVADVDNPAGGFSSSNYRAFAEMFDELVVPVTEAYFGTPSDIDDNGRTILLYTKEVNAIAAEDDGVFTAGFFFARDLLPVSGSQGLEPCPTSNEAEMLYMLVPDPDGQFGPDRSRSFVQGFTLSTIAHEQQHLVNAATRLFVTSPPLEEIWLNEGLSHIAEEAVFYEDAGLEPRENIGTFTVGSSEPVVEAFELFQQFNFLRFVRWYLQHHELHSPFDVDEEFSIDTRGAAWHFLRYAADRDGRTDPAFFRSLVQTSANGVDNLGPAVGGTQTLFDWLGDWAVAVYADDRVDGLALHHRDLSWDHHDLWRRLLQPDGPYVGGVRSLQPGSPQFHELSYGGVAYYRFGVTAGEVGSVSLREGNGAPPSEFRALLLRTE